MDLLDRQRRVQASWSGQRWDEWLATCADDYEFTPAPGLTLDRSQTLAWSRAIFTAWPDYEETVEHVHVGVQSVVTEVLGRGTATADFVLFGQVLVPGTGANFAFPYAKVLAFDADGLVRRDRQFSDQRNLLTQIRADA